MNVDLTNAAWRKSARSGANNNCVEVAGNLSDAVAVRDSKRPGVGSLVFSRAEWAAFVTAVRADQLDR